MLEEKRRHVRKATSLPTSILEPETSDILGECRLVNVSESGFGIETENNLTVGQKILLKVPFSDQVVYLVGQIVRKAEGFFEPLYGAQTSECDSVNLDIFRQYINHHLPN